MTSFDELLKRIEDTNDELRLAVYEMTQEIRALNKKVAPKEPRKRQPMSEETKAKISAARLGMKHSEETKKLMSMLKQGKRRKPFSDAWRANLSMAKKARKD